MLAKEVADVVLIDGRVRGEVLHVEAALVHLAGACARRACWRRSVVVASCGLLLLMYRTVVIGQATGEWRATGRSCTPFASKATFCVV
eukprot:scaffold1056_cov564-Prasinococcus_capsulatus_cf.AAC.1